MENTEALTEATMQTEGADTAQNTGAQADTPQSAGTDEESAQAEGAQATGEEQEAQAAQAAEEPFLLEYRYNHRRGEITDRKEAARLVQMGKKYESESTIREKLEYLAACRNQSIDQVVDEMIDAGERLKKTELEQKYGDNEEVIGMLMQQYRDVGKKTAEKNRNDAKTAYEQEEAEAQKSFESRLADEVMTLQKEFPEIKDFAALPEKVKRAALNGEDLMSAYLKHRHAEEKKTAAAQTSAGKAAGASVGKVAEGEGAENPVLTAFRAGLFN